jgi:hypothetical protein
MGRIIVHEPPPPRAAQRPVGESALATAGGEPPKLYLTSDAFAAIKRHIGWGLRTGDNGVEQGGLLIGHIHLDPDTAELFVVVKHVLEARASQSTPIYIEMDHGTWIDLLRRFDALALPDDGSPWRIVGWYHTHPNDLAVFMSGTDRETQRDLFAGPERFALVFNPHRQLWKAFQGADCVECTAVALAAADPPEDRGAAVDEKPAANEPGQPPGEQPPAEDSDDRGTDLTA